MIATLDIVSLLCKNCKIESLIFKRWRFIRNRSQGNTVVPNPKSNCQYSLVRLVMTSFVFTFFSSFLFRTFFIGFSNQVTIGVLSFRASFVWPVTRLHFWHCGWIYIATSNMTHLQIQGCVLRKRVRCACTFSNCNSVITLQFQFSGTMQGFTLFYGPCWLCLYQCL